MLDENTYQGAFFEGLNSPDIDTYPLALMRSASSHPGQLLSFCIRYQRTRWLHFPLVASISKQSVSVHQSLSRPHINHTSACYELGKLISALRHLGELQHCVRAILLPAEERLAYGRFRLGVPVLASGQLPRILLHKHGLELNYRPKDSLDRHQAESEFDDILSQRDCLKQDPVLLVLDVLRHYPSLRDIREIAHILHRQPRQLNQQLIAVGSSFLQVMEFHQRRQLVQELKAGTDGYQDVAGRLKLNSARHLGTACRRWFHRTPESIRHHA